MDAKGRSARVVSTLAVAVVLAGALVAIWSSARRAAAPAIEAGGARGWAPQTAAAAVPQATGTRVAADPGSRACGSDHAASEEGLCHPIDPQTGQVYDEEALRSFDEMRASPFVARGNDLVPRILTVAEARSRQELLDRMNALADLITRRAASSAQIEEYFTFRGRLTHYRMQILSYQHASGGGRISRHDPALDPDEITDPEVRARYAALDAEARADFAQWSRARQAHGLPPHDYLEAWDTPHPSAPNAR
jgi:hypothetical protein